MARVNMENMRLFNRPVKSIGVLSETKKAEYRVILPPELVKRWRTEMPKVPIFVATGAGFGIGVSDSDYRALGAKILKREKILQLPFVIGVKETQPDDHKIMGPGIHMTYEHFAESRDRTEKAIRTSKERGVAFIALETMEKYDDKNKRPTFPTLAPMSIAAAEIVAQLLPWHFLKQDSKNPKMEPLRMLPSGLPIHGVPSLKAVVLGGGIVGETAANRLAAMGLEVYLLETDEARRNALRGKNIETDDSNPETRKKAFKGASVLVSGVYRPGATPPKIVNKPLLNLMAEGAIAFFIDVDQGSSYAGTLPPTSILEFDNLPLIPGTHVRTFSPPNLPSMAAKHTSLALGNAVFDYAMEIARKGLIPAAVDNYTIRTGINIFNGKVANRGVAETFGLPYTPYERLISA